MNDRLQELSRQIEALTQGLGEAQKLLQELATQNGDPNQALISGITQALPKLNAQRLQSVEDYVGFLAAQASTQKVGGPGGGENQPPTGDDGP